MFSLVMVGADDLDAARTFHDAALGTLGIAPGMLDARGRFYLACRRDTAGNERCASYLVR